MINTQALAMYLVGWFTVTFLIYRYGRFSPWQSTKAGQSVMLVKCSLWATLSWALVAVLFPDWGGRDLARVLLLGFVNAALLYQIWVIVQYQGGFRRGKLVAEENEGRQSRPGT